MESLRLEKSAMVIQSNHQPIPCLLTVSMLNHARRTALEHKSVRAEEAGDSDSVFVVMECQQKVLISLCARNLDLYFLAISQCPFYIRA